MCLVAIGLLLPTAARAQACLTALPALTTNPVKMAAELGEPLASLYEIVVFREGASVAAPVRTALVAATAWTVDLGSPHCFTAHAPAVFAALGVGPFRAVIRPVTAGPPQWSEPSNLVTFSAPIVAQPSVQACVTQPLTAKISVTVCP